MRCSTEFRISGGGEEQRIQRRNTKAKLNQRDLFSERRWHFEMICPMAQNPHQFCFWLIIIAASVFAHSRADLSIKVNDAQVTLSMWKVLLKHFFLPSLSFWKGKLFFLFAFLPHISGKRWWIQIHSIAPSSRGITLNETGRWTWTGGFLRSMNCQMHLIFIAWI